VEDPFIVRKTTPSTGTGSQARKGRERGTTVPVTIHGMVQLMRRRKQSEIISNEEGEWWFGIFEDASEVGGLMMHGRSCPSGMEGEKKPNTEQEKNFRSLTKVVRRGKGNGGKGIGSIIFGVGGWVLYPSTSSTAVQGI